MTEAECIRETILEQTPPDVRARTAACTRKGKAFQIAAADWYMRQMAAEEIVERVPVRSILIPTVLKSKHRVGHHCFLILWFPRLL